MCVLNTGLWQKPHLSNEARRPEAPQGYRLFVFHQTGDTCDAMPVDPLMLEAAPGLSSSLLFHQVFCPAQVRARHSRGPEGGMRLPEFGGVTDPLLLSTAVLSRPLLSQRTQGPSLVSASQVC